VPLYGCSLVQSFAPGGGSGAPPRPRSGFLPLVGAAASVVASARLPPPPPLLEPFFLPLPFFFFFGISPLSESAAVNPRRCQEQDKSCVAINSMLVG